MCRILKKQLNSKVGPEYIFPGRYKEAQARIYLLGPV
jgi:hypothetical protein